MDKHTICRGRLKFARIQANFLKAKIPYVSSTKVHDDLYAVFVDIDKYDYREMDACCAFDARATVIYEILDDESIKDEIYPHTVTRK